MNRPLIKKQAKTEIRKHYFLWLLTAIFAIIALTGSSASIQTEVSNNLASSNDYTYSNGLQGLSEFLSLYVFAVPFSHLALDLLRNTYQNINESVFSYTKWGRNFWAGILQTLFILLWTLLLIIPGIIASYSYYFTSYLLADYPDMTAREAITLSKRMTNGHKMDLFVLDLSFLLWDIGSLLTFGLLGFYVEPYKAATRALVYEQISSSY